jgi:hypothetical protein
VGGGWEGWEGGFEGGLRGVFRGCRAEGGQRRGGARVRGGAPPLHPAPAGQARPRPPAPPPPPPPAAPPLGQHHVFDARAVAVLLLKRHEPAVQLLRRGPRQVVERVLVDGARAVGLLHVLLKLGKRHEELLLGGGGAMRGGGQGGGRGACSWWWEGLESEARAQVCRGNARRLGPSAPRRPAPPPTPPSPPLPPRGPPSRCWRPPRAPPGRARSRRAPPPRWSASSQTWRSAPTT